MKSKFKPGDLVRIAVFSYEPYEVGIILRELTWREMVEVTFHEKNKMWYIHFPDTDETKVFAENWLVLVK